MLWVGLPPPPPPRFPPSCWLKPQSMWFGCQKVSVGMLSSRRVGCVHWMAKAVPGFSRE